MAGNGAADIRYCDDDLIVVHKPSGLFVHRTSLDARIDDSLLQRVRDAVGGHVHAVHRLDRGTSGLVLFARSPAVAAALSAQFEAGTVFKRYLAIVRGHPPGEGIVDHPLIPIDPDGHKLRERPAQAAETRYRTLATAELPVAVDRYPTTRYALVELQPTTGRRHQLRRHLKHIAHPIIGDANYGKGIHNRFFAARFGVARLLLDCVAMAVDHPASGRQISVSSAPAEDFRRACDLLGWSAAVVDSTRSGYSAS